MVHTYNTAFFNANGTSTTKDVVIMDRNLGATINGHQSQYNSGTGSFGLYYQWGRKDPFKTLGTVAKRGAGSVTTSIQNPEKFMTSIDWRSPANHHLGGGYSVTKSPYDPCPEGWRVPKNGTLGLLGITGYSWSSSNGLFLYFTNTGSIIPGFTHHRSSGFPVRCVQE